MTHSALVRRRWLAVSCLVLRRLACLLTALHVVMTLAATATMKLSGAWCALWSDAETRGSLPLTRANDLEVGNRNDYTDLAALTGSPVTITPPGVLLLAE